MRNQKRYAKESSGGCQFLERPARLCRLRAVRRRKRITRIKYQQRFRAIFYGPRIMIFVGGRSQPYLKRPGRCRPFQRRRGANLTGQSLQNGSTTLSYLNSHPAFWASKKDRSVLLTPQERRKLHFRSRSTDRQVRKQKVNRPNAVLSIFDTQTGIRPYFETEVNDRNGGNQRGRGSCGADAPATPSPNLLLFTPPAVRCSIFDAGGNFSRDIKGQQRCWLNFFTFLQWTAKGGAHGLTALNSMPLFVYQHFNP